MARKADDGDFNDSINASASEEDKSFVNKVRSRVSGLFNSSISRLFGGSEDTKGGVRRRDEDDELFTSQPPCKRARPTENALQNNYSLHTPDSSTGNNVPKSLYVNFPEPVAGPSGVKSCKTLISSSLSNRAQSSFTQETVADKDSDSGESTSGYSSMVKSNVKVKATNVVEKVDKPNFDSSEFNTTKSLFNSTRIEGQSKLYDELRISSPQQNTSLSSRRPSFNPYTFGSPNFVDRTISTQKILNSPFYNGRTIYGGASAYGRPMGRMPSELRKNIRNSIRMKPVNDKSTTESSSLSKTARRILSTLEQYSTPMTDAQKIPLPTKQRKEGLLSKYTGANPYMRRGPPNKELMVPTIPELLQMKQREKLQETTETVRQIATKSGNEDEYRIRNLEDKQKHTGKIKNKTSSVRQRNVPVEEPPEALALKPVALPIDQLPKFDFVIPPPVAQRETKTDALAPNSSELLNFKAKVSNPASTLAPSSSAQAPNTSGLASIKTTNNVQPSNGQVPSGYTFKFSGDSPKTIKTSPVREVTKKSLELPTVSPVTGGREQKFTFSKPLVVAENLKSIVAINSFKFSEPILKNAGAVVKSSTNFKMPEQKDLNAYRKRNNGDMVTKPSVLSTGSVMDVLGKKDSIMEKFKPPEGHWECPVCLIRNKPDCSRCAACETPKSSTEPKTKVFGTSGVPKSGFGDNFKPSASTWECSVCLIRNKMELEKCAACENPRPIKPLIPSGFGDKFKPPEQTWECSVCMIRNKDDLEKCAACESLRPQKQPNFTNPSLAPFKPSPTTWECTTCLIRNENDKTKCAACESPKPGSFGKAFKKKSDEWECDSCMVKNPNNLDKCQCCTNPKPGAKAASTITSFNFGLDKSGISPFKFGIPTDTVGSTTDKTSSVTAAPAPFIFSNSVAAAPNPISTALNPISTTPNSVANAPPTFTFGIKTDTAVGVETSKSVVTTSESTATTTPFGATTTPSTAPLFQFKPPEIKPSTEVKPPPTNSITSTPNNAPDTKPSTFDTKLESKSATKPDNKPASTPLFSTAQSAPTVPTFNFVAAAAATTAQTNTTPSKPPVFTFGANAETPKPPSNKPFTFTSSEPPAKVPMFSFNKPPSNETPKSSPSFNFTAPAPTSGFSFGAPSTSGFGAPKPADQANPVFGTTTKNGGFNFGMAPNNNVQKAGFSFGASTTQNAAGAAASSGFNFSVPSNPPAPTTGFKFTATPPTFDATVKPNFNFTAGNVTTFSATPAEGAAPTPRKIKKAVRRTQR